MTTLTYVLCLAILIAGIIFKIFDGKKNKPAKKAIVRDEKSDKTTNRTTEEDHGHSSSSHQSSSKNAGRWGGIIATLVIILGAILAIWLIVLLISSIPKIFPSSYKNSISEYAPKNRHAPYTESYDLQKEGDNFRVFIPDNYDFKTTYSAEYYIQRDGGPKNIDSPDLDLGINISYVDISFYKQRAYVTFFFTPK